MNKYSHVTFFGLLMIPIAFGVVHAQDNNASKDPFEIMLNQAREQQKQKILQDFAESQKQNDSANMQNSPLFAKGQNAGQANQTNPNQPPNKPETNPTSQPGTPSGPSTPAPTQNIPQSSANTINTPPGGPINIYGPPPSANTPPGQPGQQPSSPPSQKSPNIYG